MEQLKVNKEWLEEKGFTYADWDDSYRLKVDENVQVRYYLKDYFFIVDKIVEKPYGHMSYINHSISTQKVIQVLEAFDIIP